MDYCRHGVGLGYDCLPCQHQLVADLSAHLAKVQEEREYVVEAAQVLGEMLAEAQEERDAAIERAEAAEKQVEGMQREGCAAVGLVQNIFNGLTSPTAIDQGASLSIQQKMAAACAKLLTEVIECSHKEERDAAIEQAEAAEQLIAELGSVMTEHCDVVDLEDMPGSLRRGFGAAERDATEQRALAGQVEHKLVLLEITCQEYIADCCADSEERFCDNYGCGTLRDFLNIIKAPAEAQAQRGSDD